MYLVNCLVKLLVGNLFPGLIFSFSSFTGAKFVQIVIPNSQHALWVVVRWWTISSGCVVHVNTEPTSKKSVLWTTAHYVMRQSDFWKYIHCTSSALLPEPSYSWSEVKCYLSCLTDLTNDALLVMAGTSFRCLLSNSWLYANTCVDKVAAFQYRE